MSVKPQREALAKPASPGQANSRASLEPKAAVGQKGARARSGLSLLGLLIGLSCLLVAVVLVASMIGAVAIGPSEIVRMLIAKTGLVTVTPSWRPADETIIFQVRMPRVVGAALVGASLSVTGALFQGLFRNPLADPFVIGTSGGAGLGAAFGLLISTTLHFGGFGIVALLAFAGALVSTFVVYLLARTGNRTPVVTLLLAGFAVSSIFGYVTSLLLILNDRLQLQMRQLYAWIMGGISVSEWSQLAIGAPIIVGGILGASVLGRRLNALVLGEEVASHLGVEVERLKLLVIVIGALLTAISVSISGLVGFVGLVVPHILRLLFGADHVRLLPTSALVGATFLVLTDLLARTLIAPTELPLGIVTALIGSPFLIALLRKAKREYSL